LDSILGNFARKTTNVKISPVRDCRWTPSPCKDKIRWPKVKRPKFKGHMTPNEDEYQKSVCLKFSYCHRS